MIPFTICGYTALGFDLIVSIQKAKLFVEKSLENSYKIGSGPGFVEKSLENSYKIGSGPGPLGHY